MKIGYITDVHLGPSRLHKGIRRKLTGVSEARLQHFVEAMRDAGEVTFAVHGGDLIEDDTLEKDTENFRKGVEILAGCPCPVHHVVGNHDTMSLDLKTVAEFLTLPRLYYSFDAGGVHGVILHTECARPERPGIRIPEEQLDWLAEDLSRTDNPAIIFIHHSLGDQNLKGNPWFEDNPDACLVSNRAEVRRILSDSGKVMAVINGHLHWNRVDMHDDIPYITVQSAVENVGENGQPLVSESWALIEIRERKFRIEVMGQDPFQFETAIADGIGL